MGQKGRYRNWSVAALSVTVGLLSFQSSASAVPLADATSPRTNFNFPLGDPSNSSYDGPAFNAFTPFASFVSPELLKLDSFTGHPLGSTLELTILSESGAFDGTFGDANSNKFGVIDANGNFTSLLNTFTAGPGSTVSVLQGANESLTLALQSPEGLFSSIDANSADGAAHILAMQVNKSGDVTVDPTSLRGTPPLTFSLLEGDFLLFIEDMRAFGNVNPLVPFPSDFDYNDMVLVVRHTAVPEPLTCSLLGCGLFAAFRRRRRA